MLQISPHIDQYTPRRYACVCVQYALVITIVDCLFDYVTRPNRVSSENYLYAVQNYYIYRKHSQQVFNNDTSPEPRRSRIHQLFVFFFIVI